MAHVSELVPHRHQAAGHPGTLLVSADGTKVAKPALPREVAFYETLASKLEAGTVDSSWRPQFFGRVRGTADDANKLILLENVVADLPAPGGFKRPTVVDLKLGTQLWDADSSAEKRARMEEASRVSTSARCGLRITGGKVWRASRAEYDVVPKEVGKSLKPDGSELLATFARFFPVADPPRATGLLQQESDALSSATMRTMLRDIIIPDVEKVLAVAERFSWSVHGSSLLIVYEADPDEAARRATDGGGAVAKAKMIDFAHAWEGEGPDEGLLLGINTALRLLRSLVKELEA